METPTPKSLRSSSADENEIADLVGPLWSASKTAEVLEISAQELVALGEVGDLLGLPDGAGTVRYPVSQFESRADRVRVRPALAAFCGALSDHEPWTVAVTVHTPAPELDGLSPLEWARQGKSPEVLGRFGARLAVEWSR